LIVNVAARYENKTSLADIYCKKISKYKETAEKIRKRLATRSSPYHDGQLWSNAEKNNRKS